MANNTITTKRIPVYASIVLMVIYIIISNLCVPIRELVHQAEWNLPVATAVLILVILSSIIIRSEGVKSGHRVFWPAGVFWVGWILCFGGILIASTLNEVTEAYRLWAILSLTIFPIIWCLWSAYPGGHRELAFILAKAMVAGSLIYMVLSFAITPFVERVPKEPLFEFMGITDHPNTNGMLCGGFLMAAAFLLLTEKKHRLIYSISFGFSLAGILASNCRSAELGAIIAFVFGGIYWLRHKKSFSREEKATAGREKKWKKILYILVICAVCLTSFTVLRFIDHVYVNMETGDPKVTVGQQAKKNPFIQQVAAGNMQAPPSEDQQTEGRSVYDYINTLSSDRLTLWTAFIPRITARGNGKTPGPILESNKASYSAHNNGIDIFYVSGYAAGAGYVIWMLCCLWFVGRSIFGRGPYRAQTLMFIMIFSMFFATSMLDVLMYPTHRSAPLMTYMMMGTVAFREKKSGAAYAILKRLIDILLGLIGCALLLPVIILVKTGQIATGDRGPLFYSQIRVGRNGRWFRIFKFRTMYTGADMMLDELLKDPEYREQWVARQKLDDDPRVTGIGKFLRKTSIDELPQLLNVLKGDMSLIGPRPLVPGELEERGGLSIYHKVRPGMTGWWICHGHSSTTYEERLELEYYYIMNRSLNMDVACLAMTLKQVITGKNRGEIGLEDEDDEKDTAGSGNVKVSVIIPTLNGEKYLPAILSSLKQQQPKAHEIIVVDSSSTDETRKICEEVPEVTFIQIPGDDFDHGGTRDMALKKSSGDVIVFLSQDAVPKGRDFLKRLTDPLLEEDVAVSTGRQIARHNSSCAEKLIREFNYPNQSSLRTKEDLEEMGIKTYFVSNVCGAYRRDVYEELGGFEQGLKTNEDMFFAAKAINSGYKIAYAADASVYHSHDLSRRDQYERNRIQGYEISRHRKLLGDVSLESEGLKMVSHVSGRLLGNGRILSFVGFIFDCCARYLGSRKGRREGS